MYDVKSIAAFALEALKQAGAEKAKCSVSAESTDETNALGQYEYLLREFDSCVVTLSASIGKRVGMARTNRTDEASLRESAQLCVEMARMSEESEKGLELSEIPQRYRNGEFVERAAEKLYRNYEGLMTYIRNNDPEVVNDSGFSYVHSMEYTIDTDAHERLNEGSEYRGGLELCMRKDGRCTGKICSGITVKDLNVPLIDTGDIREKLKETESALYTQKIPGDPFVGTLVLAPEALFSYIWPAMDMASNSKKKGKEFTIDPRLTMITANSNEPYNEKSDDLNTPDAEANFTIRNGVFVEGEEPANDEERAERAERDKRQMEQFKYHVTVVSAGDKPYEELIKGVKRGLLLGRLSGAQPDENGNFSGVAKNSFYIENGEIKYPVRATMVSGNVREMFNNVEWISSDRKFIYDCVLAPTVAVGGISIH